MKQLRIFYEKVGYSSQPEIRVLSKKEYRKLMAQSAGRGIVCRIATEEDEREVRAIERENFRKNYTAQIAEKYNVGTDWRENRWFVEQVRPLL